MLPFEVPVGSRYGAAMGRRDDQISGPVHVVAVPMCDGCYDSGGAYWGGHGENEARVWCAYNDDGAAYLRAMTREAAAAAFKVTYPACEPDVGPRVSLDEESVKYRYFRFNWRNIHRASGEKRPNGRRTIARRMRAICPRGFRFGNDPYLGSTRLDWRELFAFICRQTRRYNRLCDRCPGESGGCNAAGDDPCAHCAEGNEIESHLSCVLECLKIES